ncbi:MULTISPECIES: hypothetical protein [unclassified Streptomyces]|uniref:hypothetical protein n=1 Tax=unclassified Streptomyces TaxID=2593676 RepID=UPI000A4BD988|nr:MULTISPECIES: hypothetical protein [unclassified Streptomyces]
MADASRPLDTTPVRGPTSRRPVATTTPATSPPAKKVTGAERREERDEHEDGDVTPASFRSLVGSARA